MISQDKTNHFQWLAYRAFGNNIIRIISNVQSSIEIILRVFIVILALISKFFYIKFMQVTTIFIC